jgi:hypothetical protein
MKKISKFALATLIAASVSQVAHAAFTTNDLYLGFNQSSAQSDYIIDLGNAVASVGVGGSSVVDLSGDFSLATFNSIFTTGANGVNVAVVGGVNLGSTDVYATQIRVGGAGNAAVPGSSLAGKSHSSTVIGTSANTLSGNPWPTAGNGTNDGTKSYTTKVGPADTASDFFGKSGVNPFGLFGSPATVYLDLWFATPALAYTYKGYFTVDLSTGTPHVTFTPATGSAGAPPSPTLSIARAGTTSTISFGTTNGATYNLIFTNTAGLSAPRSTWIPVGSPIIGTGGVTNFTDTSSDPSRIYSVTAH